MWVTALAVLPDGELVSASADHTVCVWKDGTRLFRRWQVGVWLALMTTQCACGKMASVC